MHLADFQELNARLESEGKETYANPRNSTSGAVRQLDSRITAARPLVFYAYEVVRAEEHGLQDEWSCIELLRRLGFRVEESIARCSTLDEALAYHAATSARRDRLPF